MELSRSIPPLLVLILLVAVAVSSVSSPSWTERAQTPAAGGYGQAVAGAGGYVYVIRCYSVTSPVQFWRYDPATNTWSSMSAGLGDGVFRNGTCLAWDRGDHLYALAGARYEDGNRRIFLRYSISRNVWEYLENTPGPQGAGNALCWSGYDNKLYAILGSSTHGTVFARYDPSASSWQVLASPPGGTDDGCSLAWAGGRYLYALRGEYYESAPLTDFWRYDIETNTWTVLSPVPDPGGVGDGGSLIWVPDQADYLYALGGGSFDENYGYGFYRYRISANTWEVLEDLPYPVGYYNGNRLAYVQGRIFYWQGTPSAWPGGGTRFCAYPISIPTNRQPALSSGTVYPSSGNPSTVFTYEVIYADPDGDPPSYVRVYIDGSPHPMSLAGGSHSTGAVYRYTTTLSEGTHTYCFEASDGVFTVRLPSTGTYSGPLVQLANNPPVLGQGGVFPGEGRTDTTFTYEVTYTDPDGDAPFYVWVYIDGQARAMAKAGGTYTTGALYRYSTSLSPGLHSFWFEAQDNRGASCRLPETGDYSGPRVTKVPSTLAPLSHVSSFSPGKTYTIVLLLTSEGKPVTDKPVSSAASSGLISPSSVLTDNEGRAYFIYTAPEAPENTPVHLTFTFEGDDIYERASAEISGTVSPPFRLVLVFRTPDGKPLANTPIYFGFSRGEKIGVLGVTDSGGRIVVENEELAGSILFFESSAGGYRGSAILGYGGEAEVVLSGQGGGVPVALSAVLLFTVLLLVFGVWMWRRRS